MSLELAIKPYSKRNGLTLTFVGWVSALLGLAFVLSMSQLFAAGIVFIGIGMTCLVLGIAKLYEPEVSLRLTPSGLDYYHRRGRLHIDWDNIHRLDSARVSQNLDLIELPYIGFKLNKINPLLDCISPRLATGLLTEQRPLLMTAATQDEDLQELENFLGAEFTPLEVNGERYKGVLAMFGHRMQTLNSQLGYHVYLPHDCLDRSPREFISLLNQWRQTHG
ncbi:DUF2982 domain-containing protein [Shewanella sp. SR44-3]|uniref:DUF2982 domain-containing protein n=1 Tax=Shewanella sp. SR44-3 TaxID=2760936 RepID=UPI0015F972C4|nr:DUF2982 domain-containing protein [Shewanella sp. SR44-3]MBB1270656.1 DUF2982 domain-containing protein [Shewanella sp. SR44-3]